MKVVKMNMDRMHQSLAFVLRYKDLTKAALDSAARGGFRVIVDLQGIAVEDAAPTLAETGAGEVHLTALELSEPGARECLIQAGVDTIWLYYHPTLCQGGPGELVEIRDGLPDDVALIPVTGDWECLDRLTTITPPFERIALKGTESAGWMGDDSVSVLFSTLSARMKDTPERPRLHIWGGVWSPEGTAAFLACGAGGIVFESLHWFTDLVSLHPETRPHLAALRFDHTTVVEAAGIGVRIFDKGTGKACRRILRIHDDLIRILDGPNVPGLFVQQVSDDAQSALESRFDNASIVFLGPEAAAAKRFAERFGEKADRAVRRFSEEIDRLIEKADRDRAPYIQSEAARELKVKYPVIQGAMSWISDIPGFARSVADAGGLPTIALGIRPAGELNFDLHVLAEEMGDRPYALNVMALPENPHLDEQMVRLLERRPPFVVLSAGEPSLALPFLEKKINVIYVTSDVGLLKLAWQTGIRWVVLEGNEAGGHVGAQSTLSLAQAALELKQQDPDRYGKCFLVLAGGIFNRQTAKWAGILGAEALQVGTAYLGTREIVESGALSELYQQLVLESPPGGTIVTGQSIGLRIRALKTPVMDRLRQIEREAADRDETALRNRLETISAGSLYLAAKGRKHPDGEPLDEATCRQKGQFMSGAVAGALSRTRTILELHRELAEDISQQDHVQSAPKPIRSGRKHRERIAVTGWAMVNSLGNSVEEIWKNLAEMKSGITEVPRSKWDHDLYYDPQPGAGEKTYCRVGAFHGLEVTRRSLGLAPQDFRTMAESTRLTLHLAREAIGTSGLLDSNLARERIGVIVSQNSGESASTTSDLVLSLQARNIVRSLKEVMPLSEAGELEAIQRIKSGRLIIDDTTLLGRLNCAAAGFICNQYGFMGPSYSVTAACATSQVAVFNAVQMIRSGAVDAVVAGGGEERLTPAHFLEFSALGALAGIKGRSWDPSKQSRPFDADRDGMVLGEGGAMIVLERESTARARGARIYAFITGIGASNSNRGMVESLADHQRIAIRNACRDSGLAPADIDLVECHATATIQGDREEIMALKSLFPQGKRTFLTSLKSQIGHTLGASGLSSLIRGLVAADLGVIPPTLNYRSPDSSLDLETWGFNVPTRLVDWPDKKGDPKRLMVDSFGFGGANYVVQAETCPDETARVLVDPQITTGTAAAGTAAAGTVSNDRHPGELAGVHFFTFNRHRDSYRAGVPAADRGAAQDRLKTLLRGRETLNGSAFKDLERQGIFLSSADASAPPLAVLFAGQGTVYPGMGQRLYDRFPLVRHWMDRVADLAGFDVLKVMFQTENSDLKNTLWQQPALFCLEYALWRQLDAFGLNPSAVAGHSMGELTALCVAGVMTWQDGFRIVSKRAECMDRAAGKTTDPGAMVAVDAPLEVLERIVAENRNVFITNYNSPRQTVLGGGTKDIADLATRLENQDYRVVGLKVSMAFHSPIMKTIRDEMARFIADIDFSAPRIPVLSNTTTRVYPDRPEAIRGIIMDHLEKPVHFMQNTIRLRNDFGIGHFLEIGPKATLSDLINDTLPQARCIHTCEPEKETEAFQEAAARLFALGLLPAVASHGLGLIQAEPPSDIVVHSPSSNELKIQGIIQQTINTFMLESFGKYLKPAILEAIRQKVDPGFTETRLEKLLGGTVPAFTPEDPAGNENAFQTPSPKAAIEAPPAAGSPTDDALLEDFIRIIMKATGFERDEIEPEMDLRRDLAIRSSRLPVIIDAAEKQFGLKIKIKDFFGLHTVREMADRIAELIPGKAAVTGHVPVIPWETGSDPIREMGEPPLKTRTFTPPIIRSTIIEVPLEPSAAEPCLPAPRTPVLLVTTGKDSGLSADAARYLRTKWEADLQTVEWDRIGKMDQTASAGLVFVVDTAPGDNRMVLEDISGWLTGFFTFLRGFLESGRRPFCIAVFRRNDSFNPLHPATEGITGLFLTAAQEYPSTRFHCLELDRTTSIRVALDRAFETRTGPVHMVFQGDLAAEMSTSPAPTRVRQDITPLIAPGDVILITGGGRGITAHLARALAPFRPRIICLGRTLPDGDPEGPAGDIQRNMNLFKDQGLEAQYHACDLTDGGRTAEVLGRIIDRYGRIDGIIHGAGIIRDGLLRDMTEKDFKVVLDTKLSGAIHLFTKTLNQHLKFFVAVSSMAALWGNAGQANYCTANRAMSGFMDLAARRLPDTMTRTFLLPPIEGAGMADRPDVREMLDIKGLGESWIGVEEAAQFFCRELFLADASPTRVLLSRGIDETVPGPRSEDPGREITWGDISFPSESLPMIQAVEEMNLSQGALRACRTVSPTKDLWIQEHKPLKFLETPIFSGIMAIETQMESAKLLYPYLVPVGAEEIEFLRMMPCPPGVPREMNIDCRVIETRGERYVCQTSISSRGLPEDPDQEMSRPVHFQARILMGASLEPLVDWPGFPILAKEIKTRALETTDVLKLYQKHSDLTGRYRVLEALEGAGAGMVAGSMVYEPEVDFAPFDRSRYQYPCYLLEGLLHLVNFYLFLWDETETRTTIPLRIEKLAFSRHPRSGERFRLEGRLRSEEPYGYIWDAIARDQEGTVVCQASGIEIKLTR